MLDLQRKLTFTGIGCLVAIGLAGFFGIEAVISATVTATAVMVIEAFYCLTLTKKGDKISIGALIRFRLWRLLAMVLAFAVGVQQLAAIDLASPAWLLVGLAIPLLGSEIGVLLSARNRK